MSSSRPETPTHSDLAAAAPAVALAGGSTSAVALGASPGSAGGPTLPAALARAEEVFGEVVERFGAERLALAASWQKETAVLVDLMQRFAPEGRIFTLDTGVLFPQSYAVWRKVERHYGIKVEAWKGEWVDGLWEVDPDRCCTLRKVIPLRQALADADCWLTGLRRDQSPDRADTPELGWDDRHGLHKAAPLATWTDKDVWNYIFERALPYNELHDEGYASIGCTHCTLAGAGREGRWAGTAKSECGLHA